MADAVTTLVEKQAIGELKARYCRLMDQKAWDEWALCFTVDATMVNAGAITQGRQAIRDMVAAAMERIPSSHQAFLPEIALTGEHTAEGVWACMFVQANGRTTGFGHYHDTYAKVGGEWKISHLDLVTTFVEGTSIPSQLVGD